MLLGFRIRNFRSIKELRLDFSFAESRAPAGYKTSPSHLFFVNGKTRVVPCLAIFGANASGKTNTIRALEVLQQLVLGGATAGLWQPNLIAAANEPTSLALEFLVAGKKYAFTIKYDDRHIYQECLQENDQEVYLLEDGQLTGINLKKAAVSREKCAEILQVIRQGSADGSARLFLSAMNENCLAAESALRISYDYIRTLGIYLQDNLPDMLRARKMLESSAAGEDFGSRLADLMRKFDFDSVDFIFGKKEEDTNSLADGKTGATGQNELRLTDLERAYQDNYVTHLRADGSEIYFRLEDESFGTRTLVRLLAMILLALHYGRPLIIDELDRALHPFILGCIFDMFKDRDSNPKCAQLIFTTHTTDILENRNIRRSEIALINRSRKAGTTAIRVCDMHNVRNMQNFRRLYREGYLSGIPYPYI